MPSERQLLMEDLMILETAYEDIDRGVHALAMVLDEENDVTMTYARLLRKRLKSQIELVKGRLDGTYDWPIDRRVVVNGVLDYE